MDSLSPGYHLVILYSHLVILFVCLLDPDTARETLAHNVIPGLSAVMKVFKPKPGLHELYVLDPKVETNILHVPMHQGKHFDKKWKLIRIKRVVLIPRAHHTLKNLFLQFFLKKRSVFRIVPDLWSLMTSVWKLEFVVLGHSAELDMITGHITDRLLPAVLAGGDCLPAAIQVLDDASLVWLTQLLIGLTQALAAHRLLGCVHLTDMLSEYN